VIEFGLSAGQEMKKHRERRCLYAAEERTMDCPLFVADCPTIKTAKLKIGKLVLDTNSQ